MIVRVPSHAAAEWTRCFEDSSGQNGAKVQIIGDSSLEDGRCVLETSLGVAELGIDAQLKEIERGFFDLLAHRPDLR